MASFAAVDIVGLQELRSALESESVRLTRLKHSDSLPLEVTGPILSAVNVLEAVAAIGTEVWLQIARVRA